MSDKPHSEQFFSFLEKLNLAGVRYVLIRGFGRFPTSGDNDIDLLYHLEDHEKYINIAQDMLQSNPPVSANFGSAEWCEMLYTPFKTRGDADPAVANGHFRVDGYNSLFFKSPYHNFTTQWTVSKKFNDLVLANRISVVRDYGTFYTPEVECEIVLLVLRNILDRKDKTTFGTKHAKRIMEILPVADRGVLVERVGMNLPNAKKIVQMIYEEDFGNIFPVAMGYR